MELKDRFQQIEANTEFESTRMKQLEQIAKLNNSATAVIPWKADITAVIENHAPDADLSWDSTLSLLQKSLSQFLQLDTVMLTVLNISENGHNMAHELAVLFTQASELPFVLEEKKVSLRMIDQSTYIDIVLDPEAKNLVKEAIEFSQVWNKRYQNQLKMNFSFLMGKATLKMTYKSATVQKKKSYIVQPGAASEI